MKYFKLLALLLILGFLSCDPSDEGLPGGSSANAYKPVIIQRAVLETSIQLQEAKPIEETGKIYVKGNYLFINEPYTGFHIIDNSNPETPVPLKFLTAPGTTDLIFKGNSFYVNQAVDLVALKFDETLSNVVETDRITNAFPQLLAPNGNQAFLSDNEIVIKWVENN